MKLPPPEAVKPVPAGRREPQGPGAVGKSAPSTGVVPSGLPAGKGRQADSPGTLPTRPSGQTASSAGVAPSGLPAGKGRQTENPGNPSTRSSGQTAPSAENPSTRPSSQTAALAGNLREAAASKTAGEVLRHGSGRTFLQMALDLGIPQDTLSEILLPLARHFLLPLETAPLLKLRRQVLSAKTRREAAAMAASAAAAKGLELSPRGLERYAAAMDPGIPGDAPGEREEPGEGENGENRENPGGSEYPRGQDLEKKAAMLDREDPLLSILNRVPGRDGRFMTVFPFTFSANGRVYRVSVRVLLNAGPAAALPPEQSVDRMSVDIAGGSRRWVFSLDKPGRTGAETRVYTDPPLGRTSFRALSAGLEAALGDWGGRIVPAENPDLPLFPPGGAKNPAQTPAGPLFSVNEEV